MYFWIVRLHTCIRGSTGGLRQRGHPGPGLPPDPALSERLRKCHCLVVVWTTTVRAGLPGHQKKFQWKNGVEDTARLSLSAYDMIGRL